MAILYVVLVRISDMAVTLISCGLVKPVTEPAGVQEAVQVKVPPVTSGIKVALKRVAEHMGEGVALVRSGVGLTCTVQFLMGPSQA